LQKLPLPSFDDESAIQLTDLARRAWSERRALHATAPTSHAFVVPSLIVGTGGKLTEGSAAWSNSVKSAEISVAAIGSQIDEIAMHLYGLDEIEGAGVTATLGAESSSDDQGNCEAEEDVEDPSSTGVRTLVSDVL
jgi:hypothetical protein